MTLGFPRFISGPSPSLVVRQSPLACLVLTALAGLSACSNDSNGGPSPTAAIAGKMLVVSRTTYGGSAATVTVGQSLPGGGTATNDGTFPSVFKNEVPDPSFGVTSPIFIDQYTTSGQLLSTLAIDPTAIVSSFASKSELALNLSSDGQSLTFMGYRAGINALDISNSNTPALVDSTNPVSLVAQRAIGQVDLVTGALKVLPVNAYSGNNGRAAVLVNGAYYMVGNAGNGSADGNGLSALSDNTGVLVTTAAGAGMATAVGAPVGTYGSTTGYQRGFSLSQVPDPANPGQNYAADKTGKDDNFRGLTVFNNTLYVSKGSGSNGIDTVYQVGTAGSLANAPSTGLANAPITILPGFNALSEKVAEAKQTMTAVPHPFGLFFVDANTLYVADEGDGVRLGVTGKVTKFAGLQQWKFANGTWTLAATFQTGLIDQATYTAGLPWNVKTDGLRNLTGLVSNDGSGTTTFFATTSTVSDETSHDLGADPNEIVTITIGPTSTPANTAFKVLQTAPAGQRFGGVLVTP